MSETLVEIQNLKTYFYPRRAGLKSRRNPVRAVDGISFSIQTGETYGLVGESGCGKSTIGRSILRLVEPTAGSIIYAGQDVRAADSGELRNLKRSMQMVFQDPYSALNPRMMIRDIVAEPLIVHRLARHGEARDRAAELLDHCGIPPRALRRFPNEFSGGQRQRIVIARALATRPSFIVADEAVSALDVSIQAQILNLLMNLQREFRLTYLFISHDLAVVRSTTTRIGVMYLGKLVEESTTTAFFDGPLHPYSRALLSAVPADHPRDKKPRIILKGDPPSPKNSLPGCRFHTRCPMAQEVCRRREPRLTNYGEGRRVACHFAENSQLTRR